MNARAIPVTQVRRASLAAGAIAALLSAIAGVASPAHFFPAWLFAWLCVLGIALGALVNVMIHELTGGDWGFVIRRPLEAALGTLPLIALLGVPLAFGLPHLYPWAAPHADDALLAAKAWYLNTPFFLARAVVYFTIWIGVALALRRRWRAHRTNATPAGEPALRALAIGGLIVYALTMTLASVDWIMALSRDWYSTGFGLLVLTSQALCAFAFAVAVSAASGAMRRAGAGAAETGDPLHQPPGDARNVQDLGNILLMYVMMWAYLAFVQFLIIWAEDLPSEIGWYVMRSTPGWKALAVAIFVVEFALPFAAMLFRGFKRDPARLGALCAVVLLAHALQIAWQVLPPFHDEPVWFAVLALIGVGGLWLSAFATLYSTDPPRTSARSARVAAGHG